MLTNKPWSFTKASNTQQQYSSLSSDEETLAEGTEDQKLGEKEQRSFSSSSKLILVVLGVALLLNVFLLWTTLCLYKQSRDVTKSEHDDAKSSFPVFPEDTREFKEDLRFIVRPSNQSNEDWESLGGPDSKHKGFIWIENYTEYGLKSHEVVDGRGLFGVSVLHQLHCLGSIRKMFWNVVEGRIDPKELLAEYPEDTDHPSLTAMTHGLWHVSHCFDFVRQALMCRPDLTLEWPVKVNGKFLVLGWESTHQCKDWGAIWKYLKEQS